MFEHLFFEVPEERELAKEPSEEHQEHLVYGENQQNSHWPINPSTDVFLLKPKQIGQWSGEFCRGTSGNREYDKNGNHFPTRGDFPFVFQLFEAPKKETHH